MKDRVFVRGLRLETRIGAFAWERRIRQLLVADLEMSTDVRRAAATDALEDALDYKAVSQRLVAIADAAEFELVETLAEALARAIITEFGVAELELTLNKAGAVTLARDVGIRIRRCQEDYAGGDS